VVTCAVVSAFAATIFFGVWKESSGISEHLTAIVGLVIGGRPAHLRHCRVGNLEGHFLAIYVFFAAISPITSVSVYFDVETVVFLTDCHIPLGRMKRL